MRTIHDIEDAFAALADTAPDPAALSLTAPARDGARTRRWAAAGGSVLVAAAVAAAVLVAAEVTTRDGSSHRPAAGGLDAPLAGPSGGTPDLTFRYSADAPSGASTELLSINQTGQTIEYRTALASGTTKLPWGSVTTPPCTAQTICTHEMVPGSVTLYHEGAFDRRALRRGEPVDVDGHRGYYKDVDRTGPATVLFWEYAPGAWAEALIYSGTPAEVRAAELDLAESVRAASSPVRVPVDLSDLPGAPHTRDVVSDPSSARGSVEVGPLGSRSLWDVVWGEEAKNVHDSTGVSTTITAGGHTWSVTGKDTHNAYLDGASVPLEISAPVGTTMTELREQLAHVTVASDLGDRGTWFDAADVLP